MTKIFSRLRYSAAIVENTVKRAVRHSPKSDAVGCYVLRLTGYLLRSYQINPLYIGGRNSVLRDGLMSLRNDEVFKSHLQKCSEWESFRCLLQFLLMSSLLQTGEN
eukprot:scaffold14032_cov78-Skeletonema_dohrnii-CCMP3373.AAC.1